MGRTGHERAAAMEEGWLWVLVYFKVLSHSINIALHYSRVEFS